MIYKTNIGVRIKVCKDPTRDNTSPTCQPLSEGDFIRVPLSPGYVGCFLVESVNQQELSCDLKQINFRKVEKA